MHAPWRPTACPRTFQAAFVGAVAIAELVKTTLGPKGMVRCGRGKRGPSRGRAPWAPHAAMQAVRAARPRAASAQAHRL